MSKLENKVAIVTGASKGIGAEIARQLAAAGASVVVNYASSKAGAEQVVSAITAQGGKAVAVQANVAVQSEVQTLFAETKKVFGRLDILVNNAGVYEFLPLEAVTAEHFHKQFDLNVLGLLYASQEAQKLFDEAGGSIINISSVVSSKGNAMASVYSATKGAVDSLTRSLAIELAPRKIRVNTINPGLVITEGVTSVGFDTGDFRTMVEQQTPLGRVGQPSDIAPAAVFLASNDSFWITGESLLLSGGLR